MQISASVSTNWTIEFSIEWNNKQAKDIKCSWIWYLHEIASECRIRTIVDIKSWKQLDDKGTRRRIWVLHVLRVYAHICKLACPLKCIYSARYTHFLPPVDVISKQFFARLCVRKILKVFHRGKCDFSFIVSLPFFLFVWTNIYSILIMALWILLICEILNFFYR